MNLTLDIVDEMTDLHLLFVQFNQHHLEHLYKLNHLGDFNFKKHSQVLSFQNKAKDLDFDVFYHHHALKHQKVWLISNHTFLQEQGSSLFNQGEIETKFNLIKNYSKFDHFFLFDDDNILETFMSIIHHTFGLPNIKVTLDQLPKKEQYHILDFYDDQQN